MLSRHLAMAGFILTVPNGVKLAGARADISAYRDERAGYRRRAQMTDRSGAEPTGASAAGRPGLDSSGLISPASRTMPSLWRRNWLALLLPRRRDWGSYLVVIISAIVCLYVVYYFAGWGDPAQRVAITDGAYLPLSVVAVVLAARVALLRTLDRRTRCAWLLICLAYICEGFGNTLWFVYEAMWHVTPWPSVADIGWLGFIPLLLAGLYCFPVPRRTKRDRIRLALDIITTMAAGFMIVWFLVLGQTIEAGGTRLLDLIVSVAYPVGDLVLFLGITMVLLRGTASASRQSMRLLVAGLVFLIVADTYYGFVSLHDGFEGGNWSDLCYLMANLMLAVAANDQHFRATRAKGAAHSSMQAPSISRLPYMAVGLAYGALLLVARGVHLYPLGGMILGALVLTASVVGRQLNALSENRELAATDGLTGLANRMVVHAELDKAVQRPSPAQQRPCPAADRPQRVQGDQRHAWPSRRGRRAHGRLAAHSGGHQAPRHDRSSRR